MAFDQNKFDCAGYTGEYVKPFFTNGDASATCMLTNCAVAVKVYLYIKSDNITPWPQPGTALYIKAAPDLDGDTTAEYFDFELTQYNPGEFENVDEELNEFWAGIIPTETVNLIATGKLVYLSLERGAERLRDDACCLYVLGGI